MKTTIRRILSFVLVLAMVLSNGTINAFAITEEDGETITVKATNVSVEKSAEAQTAYIRLYIDKDAEVSNFDVNVAIDDPENVGVTLSGGANIDVDTMTGQINLTQGATIGGISVGDQNAQHHLTYAEGLGYVFVEIPFNIPANVTGDVTVKFTALNLADFDNASGYDLTSNTVTATITVEEPSAPPAPYEISYTLNSNKDTDIPADKYMEYDVTETVTATVSLKNNTEDDTYLQAYDLYLEYDEKLTIDSTSIKGTVFSETADGMTTTHIQAVGEGKEGVVLGDVEFNAGATVELGIIEFKINAQTAVYDNWMPITLIVKAADAAGSKTVTNIGIGDKVEGTEANGEGDATSYYPADTTTVKGAEVMTKYTVTYYDGVENETIIVPDPHEKGHNMIQGLHDMVPQRPGYSFTGWLGDDGNTYSNNGVYTGNADLNLTAQWQRNTVTITWMNGDIQLGEPVEVEYGTVPTYTGEAPTKTNTAEFTYTFAGWSEEDGGSKLETLPAATADKTYYAVFTTTTNTYTVTWKNEDGDVLETDSNVPYGDTPVYSGSPPVKESTVAEEFSFAGWSPEVVAVTGDATYTATFTSTPRTYTVTYAAGEHGTIDTTTETVEYGKTPSAVLTVTPAAGYEFTGWFDTTNNTVVDDIANYEVKGDVTLTAQYSAKNYTVTFKANGGTGDDKTQTFTFGTAQNLDENKFTAPEGYKFSGWNTVQNPTTENPGVVYEDKISFNLTTYAENVILYAQWSANPYNVSVDTTIDSTQGSVSASNADGSGTSAKVEDTINVTVTPEPGYEIVKVTYTPEGGTEQTIYPADDGTYSFKMPASNVTVTATFQKSNLTVKVDSVTNGNVNIEAGETDVTEKTDAKVGETITLNVVPDQGYKVTSVTYVKTGDDTATPVTATPGENNTYTFIMPAYGVTVNAEFEGIPYDIKFDVNGGNQSTMTPISTKYGETVTLTKNVFTKTGYTFAGWDIDPDAETATYADEQQVSNLSSDGTAVTLYAIWTPNTNTEYVVKHLKQDVDVANNKLLDTYTLAEEEELTGTSDASVTPVVKSYEGFTAPAAQTVTIAADGSTVVEYKYTRNTYTISLEANYDEGTDSNITVIYGSTYAELPDMERAGYTLDGWFTEAKDGTKVNKSDTVGVVPENTTLYAHWTANPYTITFDLNGGAWPTDVSYTDNKLAYTIESTDKLPTAEKANYTFTGWLAKYEEGVDQNWCVADTNGEIKDTKYNADDAVTGKYGSITMVAQWDIGLTYSVESYKYAKTGEKMLRIATDDNTNAYSFNDVAMYYTDNAAYKLGDKTVFVTLISGEYVDGNNELTDAAMQLIDRTGAEATVIARDGDVNGDEVVNIADANVVYQMVEHGGSYYGNLEKGEQSDILARLEADMYTATNGQDMRGTLNDVDAIVNIINGVSNTTN